MTYLQHCDSSVLEQTLKTPYSGETRVQGMKVPWNATCAVRALKRLLGGTRTGTVYATRARPSFDKICYLDVSTEQNTACVRLKYSLLDVSPARLGVIQCVKEVIQ